MVYFCIGVGTPVFCVCMVAVQPISVLYVYFVGIYLLYSTIIFMYSNYGRMHDIC